MCAESRLHAQEDIRGPLSELQQQVLPDIQDQIQDYRYTPRESCETSAALLSFTECLEEAEIPLHLLFKRLLFVSFSILSNDALGNT